MVIAMRDPKIDTRLCELVAEELSVQAIAERESVFARRAKTTGFTFDRTRNVPRQDRLTRAQGTCLRSASSRRDHRRRDGSCGAS